MKVIFFMVSLLVSANVLAYNPVFLKRLMDTNICHHCDLSDALLSDQNFEGADMSESNLKGIELKNTILKGVWFTHSRMHGANLEGADVSGALMDYSQLIDANLKNVNFTGTHLIFTDMSGADLTGSNLDEAITRGVTFCNTTMPDGSLNNDGC